MSEDRTYEQHLESMTSTEAAKVLDTLHKACVKMYSRGYNANFSIEVSQAAALALAVKALKASAKPRKARKQKAKQKPRMIDDGMETDRYCSISDMPSVVGQLQRLADDFPNPITKAWLTQHGFTRA